MSEQEMHAAPRVRGSRRPPTEWRTSLGHWLLQKLRVCCSCCSVCGDVTAIAPSVSSLEESIRLGDAGSACDRSETKPVDYLALACGAAERVERVIDPESGTSSVHLNQAQCRLLAEALSQAVRSAKQDVHGVDGASLPLFDPAFRELCRVAGDCEKLVRDCCNPNWVPVALLLADRRQEFSLRVSELKWCAKAWRTVIQHGLQGGGWLKRFHKSAEMSVGDRGGGTSDETTRLKVAFEEDLATLQANLRAKVAEMQGSWRELARYVLSRCEMIGRTVRRGGNEHDKSKYELGGLGEDIEVERVLGQVSVGSVYKIKWFQENFAAKYFRERAFWGIDKEVGAMRKISGHPRSVCFVGASLAPNYNMEDKFEYEMEDRPSRSAIVMELLPFDLDQLISEMGKRDRQKCVGCGPFPLHVTVDIMLQVAEGVEALHKVHLYHRGIKPSIVLVELVEEQALRDVGYVRVKLADYSLTETRSRWIGDTEVGTRIYMAPEIGSRCDGSLVYPGKSDTFSYPILCSHILHGELPFEQILRSDLRKQVAEGLRPELPKALPSLLASLVRRCWASDPMKRPPFAAICRELRYVKFLLTIGGEDQFRALDDIEEDELIMAKIVKDLPRVDGRGVRMVRHLGSGGFGSVDECIWKGARVAVKNLPRVGKEVVEKEAALLVRVQHPMHVVRLIGCGFNEEEEKGMLVMELMEQDLHHLIRKSMRVGGSEKAGPPFSSCDALEIMWKVATAMEHVRSCNVLHGDLKTTNILLNVRAGTSCASETHYDVKLADFGLSKYKSGNSNFTTRVSEAQYWRAPETSESDKNSWAADVFSFGVVCYEIVSGKRPFEGVEGVEVWRKVRGGERPEIPAYCGSSVGELVKACWATDPKERPDFTEICTKLEACRSM